MFFDSISKIPEISARTSCIIFSIPPTETPKFSPKNSLIISPDESKSTRPISVDQIRELIELSSKKLTSDFFFVITEADRMNESAANAFLKSLEEPCDFCHFVLITAQPSALLPTILSRAQLFIYKDTSPLDSPLTYDEKIIKKAKQLISAKSSELPALSAKLGAGAKARPELIRISSAAVEILYKSYFKTGNIAFLQKIPRFIKLHSSLEKNGNVKLHIVADLC